MARLTYSIQTSLDGYINDEEGNFGWARPGEEVHTFFNELERPIGTHLYGRRMYEMMRYWQDPPDLEAQADVHPRLRRDLAGRRQGRLLADPRLRLDAANPDRVASSTPTPSAR